MKFSIIAWSDKNYTCNNPVKRKLAQQIGQMRLARTIRKTERARKAS